MPQTETGKTAAQGALEAECEAIRALISVGEATEALARADRLRQARPKFARGHVLAVRAALAASQPDLAARALAAARDAGLAQTRYDSLGVEVARARADWAALACHAARLVDAEGPLPPAAVFAALHDALTRLGRHEEAAATLDAAQRRIGASPALIQRALEAEFAGMQPGAALSILEDRLFGSEGAPEAASGLTLWARMFEDLSDDFLALSRRAAATWPNNPTVGAASREIETLAARHAPSTAGRDPSAEARAALDRFATMPHPHLDPLETAQIGAAMIAQVDTARVRRPLIEDNPLATVVVGPAGGSGTTVLYFSGIGGHMPLSLQALDCLVACNDATLVFLRDKTRSLFLNGVSDFGGFDASVARLRTLIGGIPGHRRLCVMATSGGGLGATNYAIELGAERVLLFSPPTDISRAFLDRIGDVRGSSIQRRLQRTIPAPLLDIRARLAAVADPLRVDVHYAQANPIHRTHAENLSGVPGVTLHPDPSDATHSVTGNLALSGRFAAIIDEFLSF